MFLKIFFVFYLFNISSAAVTKASALVNTTQPVAEVSFSENTINRY